jgi:hypothetical protein
LKVVFNWQQLNMRETDINELLKGLARIIAHLDSMLLSASQETGAPLDTAPVTAALDSLVGPMLIQIQAAMAHHQSPSELFCRVGVVFKHLNIRFLHIRDHPGIATVMQVRIKNFMLLNFNMYKKTSLFSKGLGACGSSISTVCPRRAFY